MHVGDRGILYDIPFLKGFPIPEPQIPRFTLLKKN